MSLRSSSSSGSQTSHRQLLRTATAGLHAEVDARFSGAVDGSAAAYAGFLGAMASALLPIERALEEAGIERILPDWAERRRASLLLDDLAIVGSGAMGPAQPPAAHGEARQFGIVYVLEGSRLGGRLLLKRALANPDPRVRAATRYLSHGVGRDLWTTFLARLEASAAVEGAPADAIAGARAAFALFGGRPAHG